MRRLTPAVRAAMGLLLTLVLAAVTVMAQTVPPGQEGFRAATPEDLAAGQEHLPATPLVFGAYAIVWLVLVVYVLSLWRRIAKTEREAAQVAAKLEARS
jgi:CcmD family protein